MSERFKMGDRVRLDAEYLAPLAGTIRKVMIFDDGSPTEYEVKLTMSGREVLCLGSELRLVNDE